MSKIKFTAFPVLLILLSLACNKQVVMDSIFQPPADQVIEIQASEQRIGNASDGRSYLLTGPYVDSGIPKSLFSTFFSGQTDELMRGGINEGIPHEYNAFINPEGAEIVSPNCLQCHAGYVDGQFVLGLGNTNANFTADNSMLTNLLDAAVIGSFGEDSPEYRGYERFSTALKTTGSQIRTEVVGANSADKIAAVLAAHRDQNDLTWRDEPMLNVPDEVIPTDVPPWWLLKKKNAMFYTGVGKGDYARISMASSVLTLKDTTTAREIDDNFVDVIAYIMTLEAPAYTKSVNEEMASQGEAIFQTNCSACHGTYGTDPTYPNLLVDNDFVQTDASLLEANFGYGAFVDWYNGSWFGQEPNAAFLDPGDGYVAPPLDGIWASAPYLHNGSVPTLELLLNSELRPTYWKKTGDYDYNSVGHAFTEETSKIDAFTYDTTLRGYGNGGHTFGDRLTQEERMAVIEYLKTI